MSPFFGENKLGTKNLFRERQRYQDAMEIYQVNQTKFIDLWYDHPFYGRINQKGQSIYPSKAFLKSVSQKQGRELYALNFVADMFNDLVEYWNNLRQANKLSRSSKLLVISPTDSWEDVNDLYHSYMNSMFLGFSKRIKADHRIRNFDQMVRLITSYNQEDTRFGLVTKSSFIKSKYSTPLISGLMIEIFRFKKDTDRFKEEFINDSNFKIFKLAAQKFNFKLDENCPWRLIADLESPDIGKYLSKYEITKGQIFEEFYYKSFENDVENMKVYLLSFWNQLGEQNQICGAKRRNGPPIRIERK